MHRPTLTWSGSEEITRSRASEFSLVMPISSSTWRAVSRWRWYKCDATTREFCDSDFSAIHHCLDTARWRARPFPKHMARNLILHLVLSRNGVGHHPIGRIRLPAATPPVAWYKHFKNNRLNVEWFDMLEVALQPLQRLNRGIYYQYLGLDSKNL